MAAHGSGTIGAVTPRAPSALLCAGAALVVVAAALLGRPALLAGLLLLQGMSALNWRRGIEAPGAGVGAALAWLAAAVADGAAALEWGTRTRPLTPVVLAMGLGFVALFVVQLLRRHPRTEVTASLAAGAALLAVLVLGAVWLVVFRVCGGSAAVVVGALPVAVASLARLLPRPWAAIGAVCLGVLTGAVVGSTLAVGSDAVGAGPGAVVGAVGGLLVALLSLTAMRQAPHLSPPRRAALSRAGAPFAVLGAAALVYPVLRVAGG